MSSNDTVFTGSIPALYESHLVPLIFEPYAQDLAARVARRAPSRVLEVAAGTGVVTRALASSLPSTTEIVATDLNPAMLKAAEAMGTARECTWQPADAMALPFPDGTFDVVVCQFGVMFFPDKPKAFAEARRVLREGGAFLFNVWDQIADNEFADVVTTALEQVFPQDPPRFMARTPHGYFDQDQIRRDLVQAGFGPGRIEIVTIEHRSRAASARDPAVAYCQGTPLRGEIEARDASRLAEATDVAAEAIARKFGKGPVDGKIRAHVVTVER